MTIQWTDLRTPEQLDQLTEDSRKRPQIIFKHSTRCSISGIALSRLKNASLPDTADWYYLDLLNHRPLSAAIAERFSVVHESPQLLLIKDGTCIYEESHLGITADEVTSQVQQAS